MFRNVSLSFTRPSAAAAAVSASGADAPILSPTEADPKIRSIVDQISKLTLLEVAELNTVLKETLKIPDAPVMAFAGSATAAAPQAQEEEEVETKTIQTAFTLKITKFDDGKKVALIKEIKTIVEGLNLVQVSYCFRFHSFMFAASHKKTIFLTLFLLFFTSFLYFSRPQTG